jgi:hypothetical protein
MWVIKKEDAITQKNTKKNLGRKMEICTFLPSY